MDEIFDGQINVQDTVNRDDILIDFRIPFNPKVVVHGEGTHRIGKAIKYMPRAKVLIVRVNGFKRHFRISERHINCAYKTELPPKHKHPNKSDLLYNLKLLDMTKNDRDKLEVVW